ncbi:hypothetical protein KR018_010337, partial [Drosophila ironensis]
EYLVEKICGKRFEQGRPQLLIKWLGYGPQHNTWEPMENLGGCVQMICDYESRLHSQAKISSMQNDM